MKRLIFPCLLIVMTIILASGCEKTKNPDGITYQKLDKEYVLIRDVQMLKQSDDEVSNHVDSILSGLIDTEFISTGQKDFELDEDLIPDIGFEIIDLNKFNPGGLPESFDSLAARVIPLSVDILDNSTWGYPDAIDPDETISDTGNWTQNTGVLGTFMYAGQFQGKGEKFLGIRFKKSNAYRYGWIKLYCSEHNDTLRIIEYAYNNNLNSPINAGQTE